MRTATDTPENGSVVETTTRRRVVPAVSASPESERPEFWNYIESLKPEEWEGPPGHCVYIYRTDPRSSNYGPGESNIDKCSGFIEVRPGVNVPFNDRDEVQLAIREKHGGKAFRLIIKRGRERITEGKCSNDAPPKVRSYAEQSNGSSAPSVSPVGDEYSNADVAKTAMHMVANHESEAISVGVRAMQGAAEVIQRLSHPSAPAASAMDDVLKQAMILMMQRAMNPPDPLDLISKIIPLLNRGGGGGDGGGGASNPLVDKIIEAGLERVLNPPISGPSSSTGAELVRALPQIANYASEAIREWRAGSEAQLHTAEIMAGRQVSPALPPAPRPGPVAVPPAVNPTPTTETQTVQGPSPEFIESKIIEILQKPISAEAAADEVMAFLDVLDENLPAQLASLAETGLLQLFQNRPVLRPAAANLPRLQEFIKAFLKYAAENAQSAEQSAPTTVKPN